MVGSSAWLYRQVSAGLSLYAEYIGGGVGALEELPEEGKKKQSPASDDARGGDKAAGHVYS